MEKEKSFIKEYWIEVCVSLVLLVGVALAWMNGKISAETAEVIDVLAAIFALNFAFLKGKISAESYSIEESFSTAVEKLEKHFSQTAQQIIDRRLLFESRASEISSILEKLGGSDFDHASRFVDEALAKLRLIPQGTIRLEPSAYYNELTDQMRGALPGSRVLAVSSRPIERWEDNPRQENYMRENIKAISRGVKIERVFVIERAKMNGSYPAVVAEVLAQQIAAKIDVYVAWNESLWQDPSLCEDFVMFEDEGIVFTDESERVDTTRVVAGNLISNSQEVRKFKKHFKSLSETYNVDQPTFERLISGKFGTNR